MTEQPTILHLAFSVSGMHAALRRAASDDTLVLLGEGAYGCGALQDSEVNFPRTYALATDLAQRGIATDAPSSIVTAIDDLQLVDLVIEATRTVSWR